MGRPAIVLLSSHVAMGSVGLRAMGFALERLGFPVWEAPTVLLPHHPGHGPVLPIVPDDAAFAALLERLGEEARRRPVGGIISGYFGSARQADAVLRLVAAVKEAHPQALYLCDPVIGDGGRLYVPEAIAAAVRDRLLPEADIATPNLFEAGWLSGRGADAVEAARLLPPATVVVTSAPALMRGAIGSLLVRGREALLAEHPLVDTPAKGAGDLFAALVLGRLLEGREPAQALEKAAAGVFETMAATRRAGADEMVLAEAQASLVQPHAHVNLRRLAGA
jgi:pyridoxine kinase